MIPLSYQEKEFLLLILTLLDLTRSPPASVLVRVVLFRLQGNNLACGAVLRLLFFEVTAPPRVKWTIIESFQLKWAFARMAALRINGLLSLDGLKWHFRQQLTKSFLRFVGDYVL